MGNIINEGISYLRKFHNYWNLSKISSYPETMNKISYYFGIDKKLLTKENIQNKEKFVQLISDNSKKSELEEDLDFEEVEMINLVN